MFARLITNGKQRYAFSIFCDVTEMRRIETRRTEKDIYKAIATLAGGIAHEFNNALAAFVGSIDLLEMELSGSEGISPYTEAMRTSARRMTRATRQLLAYAGGGKYQERIVSLNNFIENTLPHLKHTINPSISISTNLLKDLPQVKADPDQMQMILSAVLTNASEAMEDNGHITISTGVKTIDKTFSEIKPGPYAYFSIEDKGKGMDEETKTRVFDPFFTTKFHGRGLGMAAAYGIVKNHGGLIHIDSEPATGTKVRVFLPAMETHPAKQL
jgi:signal transduction histidine kinase